MCIVAFTILAHKTAGLEEQCTCLIFYVKLGRNAMPAFEVLKIDLEDTVGRTQVFEQFSKVTWSMTSVKYKLSGLQTSY